MITLEAKEASIELILIHNSIFKDEGRVVQELIQIRGHEPTALGEIKFKRVCLGCIESVSGKVMNFADFRMHLGVSADMIDEFGLIEGVGDDFSIVMAVNRDSGFTSARLVGIFLEIVATTTLAAVTATAILAAIIVASAGGHLSNNGIVSEAVSK